MAVVVGSRIFQRRSVLFQLYLLQSCYEPDDLTNKTNKELVDLVVNNTKVIDSARNWNLLLYKEALHIKRRKCVLNNGLKASKELQLFN